MVLFLGFYLHHTTSTSLAGQCRVGGGTTPRYPDTVPAVWWGRPKNNDLVQKISYILPTLKRGLIINIGQDENPWARVSVPEARSAANKLTQVVGVYSELSFMVMVAKIFHWSHLIAQCRN